MKPLVLDFVPDRTVRQIWALTAVVLLCIAGYTGIEWRRLHAQRLEAERQLAETRRQVDELAQRSKAAPDPRAAHTATMQRVLHADLNGVFTTVERVKVPGTRLASMAIDVPSDSVTIEYRLDAMQLLPVLNEALNAGFESPRWALESAALEGAGATAVPGAIGTPAVKARWSAKIAKLK